MKEKPFKSEADLCAAFIAAATRPDRKTKQAEWVAYPETGGFDILLSRRADGFQIGVEAKLTLNAKVVGQAMEGGRWNYATEAGPDCRAVLIPEGVGGDLSSVCAALGITVLRMSSDLIYQESGMYWHPKKRYGVYSAFTPHLPEIRDSYTTHGWFERCPSKRLDLPDYVPDVAAGASAPVALTEWKVKAIKIAITIETRGYVTRADFKHHQIDMSRWISPFPGWLKRDGDGRWVAAGMPDFRAQHPVNYEQIKADTGKWILAEPMTQKALQL